MSEVSIIAAVSTQMPPCFTLNKGSNNSLTVKLFLTKLVQKLESADPDWRLTTILLLDNGKYHKSKKMKELYLKHHLPVMFLGPYHFEMASVEKFFSYIKSKNLNPNMSLHNR